jgi:hypothetical protein
MMKRNTGTREKMWAVKEINKGIRLKKYRKKKWYEKKKYKIN